MKKDTKLKIKQIEVEDNHGMIGHNSNISLLVQQTHEQLEMNQRHCPADLFDTMKSSNYDELDGGFFIHVVLYSDGEAVAIVPKSKEGLDKSNLTEKKPPEGGDYLKKECFIYFFDKYAIILSSGISDALLKQFLTNLLQKSKSITEDQRIVISDLADGDVVEKIRTYGVKQIKLKTKIDAGTWFSVKPDDSNKSFVEKVSSGITKLIRQDLDLSEEEVNNYEYELIINNKGVLDVVAKDPLINPAVDLFNQSNYDEDVTYEIILNHGKGSIKAETLKMDRMIKISRKGNSLDIDQVKAECLAYKKDLIERGVLNAA